MRLSKEVLIGMILAEVSPVRVTEVTTAGMNGIRMIHKEGEAPESEAHEQHMGPIVQPCNKCRLKVCIVHLMLCILLTGGRLAFTATGHRHLAMVQPQHPLDMVLRRLAIGHPGHPLPIGVDLCRAVKQQHN